MTRGGDAEARRLRGARRRSASSRRSSLGRPELVALAAPFAARARRSGSALAEARSSTWSLRARPRARARGRRRSAASSSSWARAPVERLELLRRPPGRGWRPRRRTRRRLRLGRATSRTFDCTARAAGAGARTVVGDLGLRCARPRSASSRYEGRSSGGGRCKVYPRGESAAARCSGRSRRRRSPATRSPRARGEGIEFADLRPFVPGDRVRRVNWRASARRGELWVNETASGAQLRRRPLPRHVRRGAARATRSTLDLAVRRRGLARGALPAGDGPRRPRRLRRHRQLALPARAGVVQLYRIARRAARLRDRPQLRVEGHRRAPGADAAAAGARDRAHAAARRARRARAARPACPRLRPRAWSRSRRCRSSSPPTTARTELAHRLWLLRREALRSRYQRLGVPVVEWRRASRSRPRSRR